MKEFKDLSKDPVDYISVGLLDDTLDKWQVLITGPPGTLLESGMFKALLKFPADYPMGPPEMTFQTEMFHPNIYADGKVCISILHPPGVDQTNEQESADERWRPILGASAVLVSVLSMLVDSHPNLESAANIDAAKMFRDDKKGYEKKVRRAARRAGERYFDEMTD